MDGGDELLVTGNPTVGPYRNIPLRRELADFTPVSIEIPDVC
jgi:hypothetical protein